MVEISAATVMDISSDRHFARVSGFSPVSSAEKLSLLETLMNQDGLPQLLQSFAAWISQHFAGLPSYLRVDGTENRNTEYRTWRL